MKSVTAFGILNLGVGASGFIRRGGGWNVEVFVTMAFLFVCDDGFFVCLFVEKV
jgi:hypothetical protein